MKRLFFPLVLMMLVLCVPLLEGEAYNLNSVEIRHPASVDTIDSLPGTSAYIPDSTGWRMSYRYSVDGKYYSYFQASIVVRADSLADSSFVAIAYNYGTASSPIWRRDTSTSQKISAEDTDYTITITDKCPYAFRIELYGATAGDGYNTVFQPSNKPPFQ